MKYYGNMGPFDPVSFKGNADVNGVPVFVDKLPLTIGGVAGEDVLFGRVVSIDPTSNRREFKMGVGNNSIIKGIAMLDPTIMRADPAQQKYYFTGRPMTVATVGIIEIREYDITQQAPMEGSTVWVRNSDGMIAFNDGTSLTGDGYTELNAWVYETLDPNGAKVAFGLPHLTTSWTREDVSQASTPTASPAAGAVAANTEVKLSTATEGAVIHYTLDGTAPTNASPIYNPKTPIVVTAGVTVKAVAIAEGYDPSEVLSAAYTIS